MVRKITKGQLLWVKHTMGLRQAIRLVRNKVAFHICDVILYVVATADKHEEFYDMVRLGAQEQRRRELAETPRVTDKLGKH